MIGHSVAIVSPLFDGFSFLEILSQNLKNQVDNLFQEEHRHEIADNLFESILK